MDGFFLSDLYALGTRFLVFLFFVAPVAVLAQPADSVDYRRSLGGSVAVTNSGFGGGLFLRRPAGANYSVTLDAVLSPVSDASVSGFFGTAVSSVRANHVLVLSGLAGVEVRFLQDELVESFRPFVLAAIGPVMAWEYPGFDDRNGDGLVSPEEEVHDGLSSFMDGRARPSAGALVALGTHFGRGPGMTQGIRLGLRVVYTPAGLRLVTPDRGSPRYWHVTPEIVVYLGRLSSGAPKR